MHYESYTINLNKYPKLKAKLAAIAKAEQDAGVRYCDCETPDRDASYVPDGRCACPIHKHHWHCSRCWGITQIG